MIGLNPPIVNKDETPDLHWRSGVSSLFMSTEIFYCVKECLAPVPDPQPDNRRPLARNECGWFAA